MFDPLFELLLALAEPILDALLEIVMGAVNDLLLRLLSDASEFLKNTNPVAATFIYGLLGALAGGCSLLIFPRHLVHPSRIPGVSVLLSPLLTGAVFSTLGGFLRSREKRTTGIETFRYGYVFAFAMAIIRLLLAH